MTHRERRRVLRVPTADVRARLRPRGVLLLYAWEALLGLLLGSSIASIASDAYGRHPDGDDPLFAADGLALMDFLRHSLAARGPILCAALFVVVAARLAGLFPSAVVLAELSFCRRDGGAPSIRDVGARAINALPATFTITVLDFALQGTFVLLGLAVAAASSPWAIARFGEQGGDRFAIALVAASLVVAFVTGIAADLTRAAVVRNDMRALTALETAVAALARHPLRLIASWAWRAAASLVPLATAVFLTTHIAARGAVALVVLGAFHQLVVGVRVAIRVSWMAKAARVVTRR